MTRKLFLLGVCAFTLLFTGCDKFKLGGQWNGGGLGGVSNGNQKTEWSVGAVISRAYDLVVTSNSIDVMCSILYSGISNPESYFAGMEVGFCYFEGDENSPEPDESNNKTPVTDAQWVNKNFDFSTTLTGLQPNTSYKIRGYVKLNGKYTFGKSNVYRTNPEN